MSRYCIVETLFIDKHALVLALIETGNWTSDQVVIYDQPSNLYGYKGDVRPEKANIIIRRKNISRASNDIGFIQNEDGQYEAIISHYDSRKFGQQWMNQLKCNYAFHKINIEQQSRGRTVRRMRCEKTGKQKIEITGYR